MEFRLRSLSMYHLLSKIRFRSGFGGSFLQCDAMQAKRVRKITIHTENQ